MEFNRQGRRGRLLLGRRHGQPDRRAGARSEGGRRLLRHAAAGRAGDNRSARRCCCTMPGSTSASTPASRPMRPRSRPPTSATRSTSIRTSITPSTTTPATATTSRRRIWPGAAPSRFFKENLGAPPLIAARREAASRSRNAESSRQFAVRKQPCVVAEGARRAARRSAGRPRLSSSGSVTAGNAGEVHSVQNAGSPVVSIPFGATPWRRWRQDRVVVVEISPQPAGNA